MADRIPLNDQCSACWGNGENDADGHPTPDSVMFCMRKAGHDGIHWDTHKRTGWRVITSKAMPRTVADEVLTNAGS